MNQEIILKQLRFQYFKGIKDLEINFDPKQTTIQGDNGLGKSTIFGGFCFLLFGKDQFESEKSGDIKTYDKNGNHLEKLDHSVEGTFLVNGQEIVLKRVLREIWSKPRGQVDEVLSGHKSFYFVNGTSCGTETEFKKEVANIIEEKTFKLLTNPHFFNEILSWQDRRDILTTIAPPLSDSEIIDKISNLNNKDRISNLVNILNSGRPLEQKKREITAKKKEIKDELDRIPARIDTATKMKPELPEGGFETIEEKVNKLHEEINSIDAQLADKSKVNESLLEKKRQKQQFIHDLKYKLQELEQKSKDSFNVDKNKQLDIIAGIGNQIASENRNISSIQKEIDDNNKSILTIKDRKKFAEERYPELEKRKKDLIERFNSINDEMFQFDPEQFSCPCPTCKRDYSSDDIESNRVLFEKAFNEEKSKKLDAIDNEGLVIKEDIEKYQNNISDFEKQISEKEEANKTLEANLKVHQDKISELNSSLETEKAKLQAFNVKPEPTQEEKDIEAQIQKAESPESTEDNSGTGLKNIKAAKQAELDELKSILSQRDTIKKADDMISEFKALEKKLSQELADLEKDEDIILEFTKTKIESIEERISGMFSVVKFKLFDTKIQGEDKPCCEATIDGVPYNIANTASKVNAGLDIINALCEYYKTIAPIFIDNRESISELIPTKSQIITLEKVTGLNLTVK